MEIDKGIREVFGRYPVVPHDEVELRHILDLMEKVPLFLEKLTELTTRVEEFAKIAEPLTFNAHRVIDKMIFHAFFIGLENRKFQNFSDDDIHQHMSRIKADIQLEGIIKSRNIACEVCGENRSTDRCHIIPSQLGGSSEPNNILIFCPTHHRLFDRFMLSRGEYASINWEAKSEASQHYANSVTLPAHMKAWDGIDSSEFRRVSQYDREFIPFVKYTLLQVLNLFTEKRILKQSNLYMVLDQNLYGLATTVLSFLIKKGILKRQKQGADEYLFPGPLDAESIDKIAFEIWQTAF